MRDVSTTATGSNASATLLGLVAWFFLVVWLGVQGALTTTGGPPAALGAAIALPLLAFASDARIGHPLFGGLVRLDGQVLIALQTFRVGGIFFIVAWLGGSLPGAFALPAGLGDIIIGTTAPLVAAAVARRRPHHRALATAWNIAGLVDLVLAVGSGVVHSSTSFGFFSGSVTTDALARYPFNLIPTFLVPLALLLHFLSLRRTPPSEPASVLT